MNITDRTAVNTSAKILNINGGLSLRQTQLVQSKWCLNDFNLKASLHEALYAAWGNEQVNV